MIRELGLVGGGRGKLGQEAIGKLFALRFRLLGVDGLLDKLVDIAAGPCHGSVEFLFAVPEEMEQGTQSSSLNQTFLCLVVVSGELRG